MTNLMDNIFSASFPEIDVTALSEIASIEMEHLGGGVIAFRNVIDIDFKKMSEWIDSNAKKAHEQRWTYEVDENGNKYALNEDRNKFSLEQMEEVPVRVLQPVTTDTELEMVELFREWENKIYKCLIRYIDEFPMVLPTLWWKQRGHIIRYDKGDYLGIHNDNDTNFRSSGGKRYIPVGQLGARQVLAALVYINDCVSSKEELNGTNYLGGELFFPYLNIEYKAKAGDIVVFPCNFYATHGVKTVQEGIRYCYLEFFSQGSPHHEVLVSVDEPQDCRDWCHPHWMDNLYDDYKKYCLFAEHNKDQQDLMKKPNPLYQNRTLEGEEGLRKAYDSKKVVEDNNLRGKLTIEDVNKL